MAIHELWNSLTFLNFNTSLVVVAPPPPHPSPERHHDALPTKIDMWRTPNPFRANAHQKAGDYVFSGGQWKVHIPWYGLTSSYDPFIPRVSKSPSLKKLKASGYCHLKIFSDFIYDHDNIFLDKKFLIWFLDFTVSKYVLVVVNKTIRLTHFCLIFHFYTPLKRKKTIFWHFYWA